MRIRKLMIKALGPLRDWEYTFAPLWTEVPYPEEETTETVLEAIRAVLYGFPPYQNAQKQRLLPPTGKGDASAAMWIETKSGTFLLGRNFTRESLEVFKLETKGLFPLPAMALMDLLLQELRILNPLDFAVVGFFENTAFTLDQNAPLVREHISKAHAHQRFLVLLGQAENATPPDAREIDPATVDRLLARLDRLEKERQRLAEEEQKLAAYGKFLSPTGEDLLALTTREYTAAALETSFYEEQIRKETETRTALQKEEEALRQKITSFDPTLYTPEMERRVNRLLAKRAELNKLLHAMEELLEQHGRKGLWSRFGGKEREGEIKQRISDLLQKLGRIREELRSLLKNKNPEDFLHEMALLEQYRKDLACLQRPSILEDQTLGLWWEELERARQKEERLRQQRECLLAMAGQEDLAAVQAKVEKLRVIKRQRQQVEEDLAAFLAEAGQATPAEARAYLAALKQKREAQFVMVESGAVPDEGELAALQRLYSDAGRFLSGLTAGKGQGLQPRVEGNLLRFSVRTEDGVWRPAEAVSLGRPDLPDLAFRLALAKAVWAETQPLLLFDTLVPWLTPKAAAAFGQLLTEEFGHGQIIIRIR
ncbi:MAG: hypothetical protein GX202_06530 [Firmicutes bacterium]|nr:hypothetical protein [Bacillota bacterium]